MDYNKAALEMHEKYQGKVETISRVPVTNRDQLSCAYTPGVAEPCRQINKNPEDVFKYTFKGRTVAVISNGTAVLGLGNIGAAAGLPVMEGKRTGLGFAGVIFSFLFWSAVFKSLLGLLLAIPLSAFCLVLWRTVKERYIKGVI